MAVEKLKIIRSFSITFCCMTVFISAYSQTTIRHQVIPAVSPDSADVNYYTSTRWRRAVATVFGINMGVWTFDRYIQKGDFAYISLNTMKENFRKGLIWDNDFMGTNMFLHPYHGSLYYNAGRANGLNYWQSGAVALGGSAMWEFLMECEYPSTNDIIATPIGGMIIGEVLFRTSDLVLNDRKTGNARFGHELAAFLISPSRGITRVVNGDAWRKRATRGRLFGTPSVSIEVSVGVRALEFEDPIIDKGLGLATNISIEYGDRYEADTDKPFDYFSFRTSINGQASQPLLGQINITGRLYSTALIDNSKDFLSLGIYQHYDYYDSDTISKVSARVPYKFSAPASVGVGMIHKSKRFSSWQIDSYLHFNAVLLGAALSDHYVVENRNYNLGSGFSWQSGFSVAYKDILSVSGSYEAYRIFTWKGYDKNIDWETVNVKTLDAQGDHSQAILHAVSLRADLKLKKRWYLTGIGSNYTRDTNYKYFQNIFSKTYEGRLMLTYEL